MKTLEEVFGPNSALVEELYSQFRADPESVPNHWRDYFNEMEDGADSLQAAEKHREPVQEKSVVQAKPSSKKEPVEVKKTEKEEVKEKPKAASKPAQEGEVLNHLKGVAGKIAENMEVSLEIPTATSLRVIPVKMLWEDRMLVNRHLEQRLGKKVTFTHLIAWAIISALKAHPSLNCYYEERDGKIYRVDPGSVNFGVAIDLPGRDGKRSLMVPNIKGADKMRFSEFMDAFDDLIERARKGKLEIPDFEKTSISLTNPGTIGTVSSMPRLMKGQGAIIATGAMNYPAEFQAMSQEVLNHLGISKVMSMTCTYDHRIIQGAESGQFLSKVHALLNGEESFYDEIFTDLDVPYKPIPYGTDNYTGFLNGQSGLEANKKAISVIRLIQAYRSRGHSLADLNPLREGPKQNNELELGTFDLSMWDLDREFYCGGLGGREKAPLREIIRLLRDTYCRKIGAEYLYIQNSEEREWLREHMESTTNTPDLSKDEKNRILSKLNHASAFEEFLHKKYIGHKRFSLEGADTMIPMLDMMLNRCGDHNVEEVLLGMAHRGRLNVLVNTLGKSYHRIFAEFDGNIDLSTFHGSGDVKYHLGTTGKHITPDKKEIKLQLLPNPSHLESVNPVVEGATRAKQDLLDEDVDPKIILPLLIHGDAAFAGQGVVPETLNMSQLDGYKTGGTIHIIINNQIGFTTLPKDGRSTEYASDLAKTILAPIFHVNGDDPEAATHAIRMAVDYRQQFGKDVIIDLICYRKHGHNEGDEPAFTQPGLYKEINNHLSVRETYSRELMRKGEMTQEEIDKIFTEFDAILEEAFDEAKNVPVFEVKEYHIERKDTLQENRSPQVDTAVDFEELKDIATRLNTVPNDFDANPKLLRILAKRNEIVANNEPKIEWGFAEALAFGSLLTDGVDIRLSGQDVERGTFSHRHSVLHGTQSLQRFVPLNNIREHQARYMVYNSLLSEFAVLGFEFGYSTANEHALVIWEAQFGDFSNGAQIIIDQYLSSSEAKWAQKSSVVMLLPHGYEGQGPEHSSARLERYLQLCAEDNLQVVNCTTPAQYFHLLRRQAKQNKKKPLIVMSPKSLLRHPNALSKSDELTSGTFQLVLPDQNVSDVDSVKRVVFCSGKVYYDLLKYQQDKNIENVAIVRLEQFYPFPNTDVRDILDEYEHVTDIVWCQEEPKNMGGWQFVWPRLMQETNDDQAISFVGRVASASPATGSAKLHAAEQERLIQRAMLKE